LLFASSIVGGQNRHENEVTKLSHFDRVQVGKLGDVFGISELRKLPNVLQDFSRQSDRKCFLERPQEMTDHFDFEGSKFANEIPHKFNAIFVQN
jgi:hypothetical protein